MEENNFLSKNPSHAFWYEAPSYLALWKKHITWIKGQVDYQHIGGYEFEELDTTDEWTRILLEFSEKLFAITMDSQLGNCETEYTMAHKDYLESRKIRWPETYKRMGNFKGKEIERSYILSFVPKIFVNEWLIKNDNNQDLILLAHDEKTKQWLGNMNAVDKIKIIDKQPDDTNDYEYFIPLTYSIYENGFIAYSTSLFIEPINYIESFKSKINPGVREELLNQCYTTYVISVKECKTKEFIQLIKKSFDDIYYKK